MASSDTSNPPPPKSDWSATQYLKFSKQRTRPVHDLIAQLTPHIASPTPRIYDLGCGPGNSTSALLSFFPSATITGIDSSPDMLLKARAAVPSATFTSGDLANFIPEDTSAVDLLFSNAAFHWLPSSLRLPVLTKLFTGLKTGGVLALQVPDNYDAPSHALMRSTALLPNQPWSKYFIAAGVGDLNVPTRPDLDPIEPVATWYDALSPLAQEAGVDIWHTEYVHVLPNPGAIVAWVRSTGLQPFLHLLEGDEGAEEAFLREYERGLGEMYRPLGDGRVALGYRRLFVVAVRG